MRGWLVTPIYFCTTPNSPRASALYAVSARGLTAFGGGDQALDLGCEILIVIE